MDTIYKRFLLFLIGCIGTRILFVIIAKNIYNKYLPYLGYLAMVPAIGFIYIYLTNSRQTGAEVFGGKIWWNNIRP
jgi:Na+/H+ antiporter NhaC